MFFVRILENVRMGGGVRGMQAGMGGRVAMEIVRVGEGGEVHCRGAYPKRELVSL